ncbi:serine-rich adhesin for platelets-like [Rhagoletis pomonella]|uniref:serine-rich adhesin for platelets-like n=1 Tax=Rhagoletis pomonella TaxID=28610 RepID=UPI0017851C9E|nr:serine-rich adhesin for platelets-like [Rhagoletis pomonella]
MQNVGSKPDIRTDDLDLAKVGSATPSSDFDKTTTTPLTDPTSSAIQVGTNNPECVQSDPETRRKSKARSRFTSALRKLSGRKKRASSKDTSTESSIAGGTSAEIVSAPETVFSSGGEETGDTNATASSEAKPKKKSKLARRFLLGSLKKSKHSAKKSIDEDDEAVVVQGSQEEAPFEDADDGESPHVDVEERTTRKVKISLSETQRFALREQEDAAGEQQQLAEGDVGTAETGSPTETDYLTPVGDKAQPSYEIGVDAEVVTTPATSAEDNITVASPAKGGALSKKKKLKTKKGTLKEAAVTIIKTTATTKSGSVSTAPSTSTQKHTAATVQKTTRTTTVTTDEKFVITQSTRDTPPRERAPAKPSRLPAATNAQPPTANLTTPTNTGGVVRKTNTRTPATLTSPSLGREQLTSFGAVSIAATVAGKRQRTANSGKNTATKAGSRSQASSKPPSSPLSTASSATTTTTSSGSSSATTAKSRKTDTELMQTSQSPLQRGHRFPKPSPTTLTPAGENVGTIAAPQASASAATQLASRSNVTPKLASPTATPTIEQSANEGTLTTVEENRTKPTNATTVSSDPQDAVATKADETVGAQSGALEAIQKQIQFQLESHASISNQLSQDEYPQQQQQQRNQQKLLVAPQLSVDDIASPPQSLQSNVSLSVYHQQQQQQAPPSYTPPSVPSHGSTTLATLPETRSLSHFRHPSSTKVIFPDPGIYNDDDDDNDDYTYADKSEALLYIADESVTPASSSGVDDVVSSAESAQPSDYSGNNIRYPPNLTGHALRSDFGEEEQTHGPPLQPTVRFAVGSVVRPQATSYESPLHDHSSCDSNPSSDSHSEASRRRIRYVSQPDTFDEDTFDSILQRRENLGYNPGGLPSEYSVDSEYDSGDNQMPAFGDLTMEQEEEPVSE